MSDYKRPLSAKEEARERDKALESFLKQYERLNPKPHTDVESVMYEGRTFANSILLFVIQNIPLMLLIALGSLFFLVADKTISVFGRTHLTFPAPFVGTAGFFFMNLTLLITSFGGELERIRSGNDPAPFTLIGLWHKLGEFIGWRQSSSAHHYSMAGFANLLLTIDICASVAAVWLSIGNHKGTPQEIVVTIVLSFAVGSVSPLGIHKLGGMLASYGNRALQQEIDKRVNVAMEGYKERVENAWNEYWQIEGAKVLHNAFVRKHHLSLESDTPYLSLDEGDGLSIADTPLLDTRNQ